MPFLASAEYNIRKDIYPTNDIESVNRQIRKIIKSNGCCSNDETFFKLLF
ncbi:MAG: transposase [Rickettsiaceae bacterium]|nr:transposase [Rickettsiaceae bacterium]